MAPIAQVGHVKGLLRWLADLVGDNSEVCIDIFDHVLLLFYTRMIANTEANI